MFYLLNGTFIWVAFNFLTQHFVFIVALSPWQCTLSDLNGTNGIFMGRSPTVTTPFKMVDVGQSLVALGNRSTVAFEPRCDRCF